MPNRQLTQQDNFETIITWLNENLSNPFMAQMQSLPINDNNRGIYFWFMKPEGYQRLSSLGLNITAINPGYSKVVDGVTYHLVYLGTAGTGKKGNSNIIDRLNWHLKTAHQENDVCSGFLSTLRQTVGAALSEDLINNNTGEVVSTFFSDFFYLCTLPYLGDSNTKSIIDEDEHCLISTIKPLFNIKNNPNARITAGQHPTRQLKVRRGLVMYKTRERLGYMKGDKGIANHQENDNKPPESPINNYEIISEHNGCIEFTVTKEQSIHEVVSGIDGLPAGKCEIVIYNSVNPDEFLYASEKNVGKRITGRRKINIYGYFKNPDTNKNSQSRWKLIQQEMRDKEIEEITVRVFSDNGKQITLNDNSCLNEAFTILEPLMKQKKSLELIKSQLERLNISKRFIFVFPCSDEKNGEEFRYKGKKIQFKALSDVDKDEYKTDDYIPNLDLTWKKYISSHDIQNSQQLLEGNALYKRKIYKKLADCFGNRFYISSAGWGIIRNKFKIPKYDITFKKNKDKNTYRDPKDGFSKDLNHLLEAQLINDKEDIVFLGGLDYVTQFFELTKELTNKKFILCNGELGRKLQNKIQNSPLFTINNFNFTDRQNWHVNIAEYLVQIYSQNRNA